MLCMREFDEFYRPRPSTAESLKIIMKKVLSRGTRVEGEDTESRVNHHLLVVGSVDAKPGRAYVQRVNTGSGFSGANSISMALAFDLTLPRKGLGK